MYEGTTTGLSYEAFEELKRKGYNGKLINVFSIKPIDIELINNLASTVKGVVTVENHSIFGGLGGAVAEIVAQKPQHAKIAYIGVQDVFTESGKALDVKEKYGLNIKNVVTTVETVMQ